MTTFIADWVIQDLLIYAIGIITILFIIEKEPHPDVIILEMICFCLMDAAVYENLATYIGLYGYGQSLIMVWNVPLSIPIVGIHRCLFLIAVNQSYENTHLV